MRNGMTKAEIEGEATIAILAGNDTSAAVLRSTMLQLMLAPHAYSKLKREIKSAVEKGEVSSPITNEQSLKLPYTQVSSVPPFSSSSSNFRRHDGEPFQYHSSMAPPTSNIPP